MGSTFELGGVEMAVRLHTNDLLRCVIDQCKQEGVRMKEIFECRCTIDKQEITLFPMKCRPDKPTPNDLGVIAVTFNNVLESIQIGDLIAMAAR